MTETESGTRLVVFLGMPNPNEKEAMAIYTAESQKLSARFGVKPLVKLKITERVIGECGAGFFAVGASPTAKAAKDLLGSDEYAALISHRERAFKSLYIFLVKKGAALKAAEPGTATILVFATPNPAEKDSLVTYNGESAKLAGEVGGCGLAELPIEEQLFGDCQAAMLAIGQYPDADAFKGVLASKAYEPLIPHRKRASKSLNVYTPTE